MKNQRSYLVALSAILLILTPVVRGGDAPRPEGPPPHERRERMGEKMAEVLGLSEDQKVKMKQINEQERAEMEALRDSTTAAKEERRAQMKAIHEKYKAQRDALLTPEQKTKAEQMRGKMEERRERMEKRLERREKSAN